jgi:hypothetical protein
MNCRSEKPSAVPLVAPVQPLCAALARDGGKGPSQGVEAGIEPLSGEADSA